MSRQRPVLLPRQDHSCISTGWMPCRYCTTLFRMWENETVPSAISEEKKKWMRSVCLALNTESEPTSSDVRFTKMSCTQYPFILYTGICGRHRDCRADTNRIIYLHHTLIDRDEILTSRDDILPLPIRTFTSTIDGGIRPATDRLRDPHRCGDSPRTIEPIDQRSQSFLATRSVSIESMETAVDTIDHQSLFLLLLLQ
jgi:hypothetical protein